MNVNKKIWITILILSMAPAINGHGASDGGWVATSSGCMVYDANPLEKNSQISWTGTCSDGYADGTGTLAWSNGNRYQGKVLVGKPHGTGVFYWSDGSWYEGEFRSGYRDGIGTHYYGCSGKYRGQFHLGVMDGVGVYELKDGNYFEGNFRNGKLEGIGIHRFADGTRYEGEFKNNEQDGLGTLYLKKNAKLEGEFRANLPSGPAVATDIEGAVFEGTFVEGHVKGRGILTKANGERDVGEFRDSKGRLQLIRNIGPPLYESCQPHCGTIFVSCMQMRGEIELCANQSQTCTTSCKRKNQTVRELKGIVEIGDIDDTDMNVKSETKTESSSSSALSEGYDEKAAVRFVNWQVVTTSDLRSRLLRQKKSIEEKQEQVANITATISNKFPGLMVASNDCNTKSVRR
jgi:hypothetical protein